MREAVVIGVSAGGMEALATIIPGLCASFSLPVVVAQHVAEGSGSYLAEYLDERSLLTVREAEEKEALCPGTVYLAPPGYHLLIERDRSFSLSADPRVNFSCPSIDVLFESAADAYGPSLIGIVLTGANSDGSHGLAKVKEQGGLTIVQDPRDAQAVWMPRAALEIAQPDYIARLEEIAPLLMWISQSIEKSGHGTGTHS